MNPRVVAPIPAGFQAVEIDRPKVAESAGARIVSWESHRDPDGTLVSGCVATPIPGWVEDMRPNIEGRTVALAGAATEKIVGQSIDARPDGNGFFALRLASRLDDPPLGRARTFLGFSKDDVLTCFATCVGTSCEASVAAASLEGSLPPPKPGLVLGSVEWAVHHPRDSAGYGAGFVVFAAVLAVVTRRKPRTGEWKG